MTTVGQKAAAVASAVAYTSLAVAGAAAVVAVLARSLIRRAGGSDEVEPPWWPEFERDLEAWGKDPSGPLGR
jgi:hypothetical protein